MANTRPLATIPHEVPVQSPDRTVRLARGTHKQIAFSHESYLREETIAGIVHDLKTPLTTIGLELSLLEVHLGSSPDARKAIVRIEQNTMYMDRMIRDLLDAASVDDGQLVMRFRTTELRSLLAEVVERVVSSRDRRRVTLYTPEAILAKVDDTRLERVLANLLTNALKYSPPSSDVTVRLERRGGMACVSVIDMGPGLTPDEALHVFDKYQRTASATRHDGVGLGLYVSRKIIEHHDGVIGVESLAKGSRFYFEIPHL